MQPNNIHGYIMNVHMYTANINIKNKLVNFGSFIEKLYKALIRKEIITLVFFFTTNIFVEMNV